MITDKDINYDLIILGAGAAGLSAGIYAARAGLSTLLLAGPNIGGQIANADFVENYPGFPDGISGVALMELFMNQARRLGVQIKSASAKSLDISGDIKSVELRKETLRAKAVILATGAQARKLGIEGETEFTGKGVSYCATCDGSFYKDKTVAVIGGGDTALSEATFLARIAKKVFVVHRRDEFRAAKRTQDAALSVENVSAIYNAVPEKFLGDDSLYAVLLKDTLDNSTKELRVDGVFVAVGNDPQGALFADLIETRNGYAVTDERCRTSVKGVYAAGDIRFGTLRQVVTAAADGARAATEAAEFISS